MDEAFLQTTSRFKSVIEALVSIPLVLPLKKNFDRRLFFNFDRIQIVSILTRGALYDLKCNIGDYFRWFVKSNEVSIAKIQS